MSWLVRCPDFRGLHKQGVRLGQTNVSCLSHFRVSWSSTDVYTCICKQVGNVFNLFLQVGYFTAPQGSETHHTGHSTPKVAMVTDSCWVDHMTCWMLHFIKFTNTNYGMHNNYYAITWILSVSIDNTCMVSFNINPLPPPSPSSSETHIFTLRLGIGRGLMM